MNEASFFQSRKSDESITLLLKKTESQKQTARIGYVIDFSSSESEHTLTPPVSSYKDGGVFDNFVMSSYARPRPPKSGKGRFARPLTPALSWRTRHSNIACLSVIYAYSPLLAKSACWLSGRFESNFSINKNIHLHTKSNTLLTYKPRLAVVRHRKHRAECQEYSWNNILSSSDQHSKWSKSATKLSRSRKRKTFGLRVAGNIILPAVKRYVSELFKSSSLLWYILRGTWYIMRGTWILDSTRNRPAPLASQSMHLVITVFDFFREAWFLYSFSVLGAWHPR